jgi:hypothetical protein
VPYLFIQAVNIMIVQVAGSIKEFDDFIEEALGMEED